MLFGHQMAGATTERSKKVSCNNATKSVPYSHNRTYCEASRKMVRAFPTEDAADRFIAMCSNTIAAKNGYAPVRSYWCSSCRCYHVTSQPLVVETRVMQIPKALMVDNAKYQLMKRTLHRTLSRIDKLMRKAYKAMSLFDMQTANSLCEECVALFEQIKDLQVEAIRRQRLLEKLKQCVCHWTEVNRHLQQTLLKVEYHPVTIMTKQWYMDRQSQGYAPYAI